MRGFHAHDNWWFEGLADGSVVVYAPGLPGMTFSADTWASIVHEVGVQSVQQSSTRGTES
jgi:hypothetical protein